jgi:chromate transporter
MQRALPGINAAVVGLLLAAFAGPVWNGAILSWPDLLLAVGALLLLEFRRWPSWLVVLGCALVAGVAA